MPDHTDLIARLRDPVGAMRPTITDGHLAADAIEALTTLSQEQALEILSLRGQDCDMADEIKRLREALVRLRDCDWVISLPDRMDAVRDIARAALGET